MDNFGSIEIRWFYPGVLPDEISKWFATLGKPLEKIDTRSDFYLQSSSPDIGVKLRQGNLEVKSRQQDWTIVIDGWEHSQVEQWTKWICLDDRSSLTSSTIGSKLGWIKVDKIRDRRLYRVDFNDRLQLTQIPIPIDKAVAIEMTQLQVKDRIWWTIACEYLGNNISIDLQFVPLVRSLLVDFSLADRTRSISCGYPQWLNQVDYI